MIDQNSDAIVLGAARSVARPLPSQRVNRQPCGAGGSLKHSQQRGIRSDASLGYASSS